MSPCGGGETLATGAAVWECAWLAIESAGRRPMWPQLREGEKGSEVRGQRVLEVGKGS